MQECFQVLRSLVHWGELVRRGQIVGLLKDCLQSLLGIVEEEKKETKSGIKSWPFSWAWIENESWLGKKWARKLDQRLEKIYYLKKISSVSQKNLILVRAKRAKFITYLNFRYAKS